MRNMRSAEFLDRVKRLNRQSDQELLSGASDPRDRLALAILYELTRAKDKDGLTLDQKFPNLTKGLRVAQSIVQARVAKFDDSFTDFVEGKGSFKDLMRGEHHGGGRLKTKQQAPAVRNPSDEDLKQAIDALSDRPAVAEVGRDVARPKLLNTTDGSRIGWAQLLPQPERESIRPSKARTDGRIGEKLKPEPEKATPTMTDAEVRKHIKVVP